MVLSRFYRLLLVCFSLNATEVLAGQATPAETFMDNTIVDKLSREGFFDRLYKRN